MFGIRLSLDLKTTDSAGLAGQQAPGTLPSLHLSARITNVHYCTWPFCVGSSFLPSKHFAQWASSSRSLDLISQWEDLHCYTSKEWIWNEEHFASILLMCHTQHNLISILSLSTALWESSVPAPVSLFGFFFPNIRNIFLNSALRSLYQPSLCHFISLRSHLLWPFSDHFLNSCLSFELKYKFPGEYLSYL